VDPLLWGGLQLTAPKMAHNHVLENDVFEDEVDLEAEEETMLFFNGLLRWDEGERAQFMEMFSRSVKSWMSKTDDIAAQRLLEVHLPSALMMSVNAPFGDIRTKMKKLLEEVQVILILECANVKRSMINVRLYLTLLWLASSTRELPAGLWNFMGAIMDR